MSIGQRFRFLNISAVLLVVGLIVTIALAVMNQTALNLAQEVRYESEMRAMELRTSSEDLTRLARTYVVTGDPKYEAMYWAILDVRNGRKARPDGRTVALNELMKSLGFTEAEFAKLKEAENNSNALVKTETIAMNAVKGRFDDGSGAFNKQGVPDQALAIRIMHDEAYHQNKEIIMKPISEFEALLNARTQESVDRYVFRGNLLLGIIGFLSGMTAVSLFFMVRSVRAVLGQIVRKLRVATDQAAGFTDELVSTAKNLSDSSSEQAAAAQETAATLDQINAMVAKSEENARKSSLAAQSGMETAEAGRRSVEDVVQAIAEINDGNSTIVSQVEEGNRQLAEIIEVIAEIGEKTKVINDIVFQTKLLSFNASVEAARAGEMGKGFAVVAEEVGNLARMSGSSAREISDLLGASSQKVESIISDTTQRISGLVDIANARVQKGTVLAEKCGESLSEVVRVSGELKGMVEEISRAAGEQAKGVNAITKAVEEINASTQANAHTSEVTASLSESLKSSNRELLGLVETIESEILSKNSKSDGSSRDFGGQGPTNLRASRQDPPEVRKIAA